MNFHQNEFVVYKSTAMLLQLIIPDGYSASEKPAFRSKEPDWIG